MAENLTEEIIRALHTSARRNHFGAFANEARAMIARMIRELESASKPSMDALDLAGLRVAIRCLTPHMHGWIEKVIDALESASQPSMHDEPVAWSYEGRQPYTDPVRWCEFFMRTKPDESNDRIRNVHPLYAHTQASQPGSVEADKRDAERYRYLRDEAWGCDKRGRMDVHVCQFGPGVLMSAVTELAEEALDEAIDAALSAANGDDVKREG